MSTDRRARAFPFRLKSLGIAVASAMLAANVHAAALGNLTVLSALGQPLRAEIELISTGPEEQGALVAKVASFDTFRQANIEYNPVLSSLRFAIEQHGERRVIRITSVQPVNEPFVDLLLELRGTDSRLVREYLFLLDPPLGGSADGINPPAVSSPATAAPSAGGVSQQLPPAPPAQAPAAPRAARAARAAKESQTSAKVAASDAPVRSRQAAGDGKAKLSLTDISVSPGGGTTYPVEERVAMEKAVAEANERVKMLEQKVDAMQKLLAATNNLLAELRKHNDADAVKAPAQPPATPATTAPAASAASPALSASVPAASAPAASAEAKPAEAAGPAPAPAPQVAVPVAAKPRPAPPPPPPETGLLDNLFLTSIGGLLALVLGGAGAYFLRRRRKQESFDSTLFVDSDTRQHSIPAPAIGQESDTGNSVYIPGYTDSMDSSGGADPVAEADVYIAYGRDVQAEQILQEALQKQPERHAVRLKLLSIYASRKDRGSFERLARELQVMTGGRGEEWASATALGIAIDPANALYASGAPAIEAPALPPADGPDLDDLLAEPAAESAQDNRLAFDSTVPALPDVDSVPAGEAVVDASAPIDLDFALGVPPVTEEAAPEMPVTGPVTGQVVEQPAAEERGSGPGPIDFDLGLPGQPLVEPAPEVPEEVVAEIAGEIAADIPPLEFAADTSSGPGPIEFELPELPAADVAAAPEPAVESAVKTDTASGPGPIDFDFELPEIPALAQPEEAAAEQPKVEGAEPPLTSVDLDSLLADIMPAEKKSE